jgi:hypothetical protein
MPPSASRVAFASTSVAAGRYSSCRPGKAGVGRRRCCTTSTGTKGTTLRGPDLRCCWQSLRHNQQWRYSLLRWWSLLRDRVRVVAAGGRRLDGKSAVQLQQWHGRDSSRVRPDLRCRRQSLWHDRQGRHPQVVLIRLRDGVRAHTLASSHLSSNRRWSDLGAHRDD